MSSWSCEIWWLCTHLGCYNALHNDPCLVQQQQQQHHRGMKRAPHLWRTKYNEVRTLVQFLKVAAATIHCQWHTPRMSKSSHQKANPVWRVPDPDTPLVGAKILQERIGPISRTAPRTLVQILDHSFLISTAQFPGHLPGCTPQNEIRTQQNPKRILSSQPTASWYPLPGFSPDWVILQSGTWIRRGRY